MVKEPVKLTKLLSKKSDGKRESEGNKALRIPQKLVFIFHSLIYPRLIPFLTKFSSPPGIKKKQQQQQQQQKTEMNLCLRSTKAYVLLI